MLSATLGCTRAQSMENAPPARYEDDGWTTLAGAVEVQLAAADVDQSAGGRVSLQQLPPGRAAVLWRQAR